MVTRALDRYALICLTLDSLAVLAALAGAEALRRTVPLGVRLPSGDYVNLVVYGLAWLCWLVSAFHFNLYQWRWTVHLASEVARIVTSVSGFALLLAAVLYLSFREVPRLLFLYDVPLTYCLSLRWYLRILLGKLLPAFA